MAHEDRLALLQDLEFKIEIPAITGLALKSNLSLPWNKLRNLKRYTIKQPLFPPYILVKCLCRWLNEVGVKIASEKTTTEAPL